MGVIFFKEAKPYNLSNCVFYILSFKDNIAQEKGSTENLECLFPVAFHYLKGQLPLKSE